MNRPNEISEVVLSDVLVREERAGGDVAHEREHAYREKMGRVPIYLSPIEFRILQFLAATPYRPYSRQRIAEAASTEEVTVTADSLDEHIASLRRKLGFFRDYVQSVPYMGYMFKE